MMSRSAGGRYAPIPGARRRRPRWKLAVAAALACLGPAMFGAMCAVARSPRSLSAAFERRILAPPGEAPLNLRFFSGAVKTASRGQIITGPTTDPVKKLVGAEPAGERGGMQRYTRILFGV